jgi:hypothetical protein
LARSFRYYGKKRGHRRTGSPVLGRAGEAIFWAVLLLLGTGGIVVLLMQFVVPEWRVNHEFVATTCKVLDKRIGERKSEDGPLFRPEIRIEYEAGGTTYRDWHYDIHQHKLDGGYFSKRDSAQNILDQFTVSGPAKGPRYPCWYDPLNPSVAVLVRGYRPWLWWAFTVPASFVLIGAGGLVYTLLQWGRSAEQRAVLAQRVQERDFFGAGGDPSAYQFVPAGADITNSPGTRLSFRLPMTRAPAWALFGSLVFCVVWNVAVLVAVLIALHMAGPVGWFLAIFLPLGMIGLGAIGLFLRQLLVAARIGPTLLEISGHPLRPGSRCRLFLSQSGRLVLRNLRVSLVCDETATYRQGTNSRTETQEVERRELFRRPQLPIERGLPFETELDVNVPEGAMHSFKADHNEINWALRVESDLDGRPAWKRSFPVIVLPAQGDTGR